MNTNEINVRRYMLESMARALYHDTLVASVNEARDWSDNQIDQLTEEEIISWSADILSGIYYLDMHIDSDGNWSICLN